jgi:hypothetical protein
VSRRKRDEGEWIMSEQLRPTRWLAPVLEGRTREILYKKEMLICPSKQEGKHPQTSLAARV